MELYMAVGSGEAKISVDGAVESWKDGCHDCAKSLKFGVRREFRKLAGSTRGGVSGGHDKAVYVVEAGGLRSSVCFACVPMVGMGRPPRGTG